MKLSGYFLLISLCFLGIQTANKNQREGRQSGGRATVISCRVFRKGVCKKTKQNIIVVNKSIASSHNCQQFCYATPGCAAFTHFEQSKYEDRKCVLFRDCNGKLSTCKDCISGPIMPRITECLAARQEVAPESSEPGKPCSFGCTGLCLGPRCPELVGNISNIATTETNDKNNNDVVNDDTTDTSVDNENSVNVKSADPNEQGNEDYSQDDSFNTDYNSYDENAYDDNVVSDADDGDFDYNSDTEYVDDAGSDYDYDSFAEVDTPVDLPLDIDGIDEPEEEDEEVDVNIDEGFLSDSAGNTVDIPPVEMVEQVATRSGSGVTTNSGSGATFIFFFCVLGGVNSNGPVSFVDMLQTGLGNALQSLTIPRMPRAVMRGGEVSSSFTNGKITTCGSGTTKLSPYGYLYMPGTCFDYNIQNNDWKSTGAALTSFRKGATITKLGRYLLATGGIKEKKSLKTIEAFDPKRPGQGWKKLDKLRMPAAVSEHCTVTVEGRKGKEVVITGGRGRETRALKLDVNTQRWYSLNRMTTGRRKHACVKAKINGRPGLIVSGGSSRRDKNMTSVEFFDAMSGEWLSLPSLNRGRRSHVMTVTKGKLLVAGGEGLTRQGKVYLDDMEVFNGQRWVTSNQKLDRARSNFSLVKIPKRQSRSLKRPRSKSRSRSNIRNRAPKRTF